MMGVDCFGDGIAMSVVTKFKLHCNTQVNNLAIQSLIHYNTDIRSTLITTTLVAVPADPVNCFRLFLRWLLSPLIENVLHE